MKSIKVQTGGKLYIAGEYAILTPGQTALIKNIPIHMTATIKESDDIFLFSDMFGYWVNMTTKDSHYTLIQQTIKTFMTYTEQIIHGLPAFALIISGYLGRENKKFGIGSSGSVVVLTLKALSAFYDIHLSEDTIFKLASYTLLTLGDNGSMGDIACITYNHLIAFTSFNRQRVSQWIATENLHTVLDRDWGYRIDIISPALPCEFLVGWTKQPSISKHMIDLVKTAITKDFLDNTNRQVKCCQKALQSGDKMSVKHSLQSISDLLNQLSPMIYNESLTALKEATKDLDVIAKSSGSGGGDCGIALSFSENDSLKLIKRWRKAGIELLYQEKLTVSQQTH